MSAYVNNSFAPDLETDSVQFVSVGTVDADDLIAVLHVYEHTSQALHIIEKDSGTAEITAFTEVADIYDATAGVSSAWAWTRVTTGGSLTISGSGVIPPATCAFIAAFVIKNAVKTGNPIDDYSYDYVEDTQITGTAMDVSQGGIALGVAWHLFSKAYSPQVISFDYEYLGGYWSATETQTVLLMSKPVSGGTIAVDANIGFSSKICAWGLVVRGGSLAVQPGWYRTHEVEFR